MVLLPKINEDAILENLRKRYMDDYIFVSFVALSFHSRNVERVIISRSSLFAFLLARENLDANLGRVITIV